MEGTNTQTSTQNVGTTAQQQEQQQGQQQEKLFTQEELEENKKTFGKGAKKIPFRRGFDGISKMAGKPADTAAKMGHIERGKDTFAQQLKENQKELEQLKRERFLLSQGIALEDADYYAFKISKTMEEGEAFETAAKQYLKEKDITNRQHSKQQQRAFVSFGKQSDGGTKAMSIGDEINRKLRGEI